MPANSLFAPVIALVLWTFVMWTWMYVTRLPAIRKSRMRLDPAALRGEQMAQLPAKTRWKADNYNHLLEQPQLFYAVALVLAGLQQANPINLTLAWAYVIVRVAHSLWQALINVIEVRFALFALGSCVLFALTLRAAQVIWSIQ